MMISLSRIAAVLAALALLVPTGRAGAAELKVLSTVALLRSPETAAVLKAKGFEM